MPILLGFLLLTILVILQSAVVSRMPLLLGTPDLIFLTITAWAVRPRVRTAWHWAIIGGLLASLTTALPFGTLLIAYLITTGLAIYFRQRVWRVPVLAMLTIAFIGTLLTNALAVLAISLSGTLLPLLQAINLVIIPSLLLNILLALPVYLIIGDVADRLYPEEL